MSGSTGMVIWFLLLFSILLSSGMGAIVLLLGRARRQPAAFDHHASSVRPAGCFMLWPGCWLAIKSRNPRAVQSALGLRNPKSCSWLEGLAEEEKLFITPAVQGWILVTGTALPDPCEDVDACFRFVLDLSRKLGQVQFFSASRLSQHHAWIKAESGRVVRAYAWAGKTLWNQGLKTPTEEELGLKCYEYTEPAQHTASGWPAEIGANVENVPLLAARWGFDPAWISEGSLSRDRGVIGEPSRRAGAASTDSG